MSAMGRETTVRAGVTAEAGVVVDAGQREIPGHLEPGFGHGLHDADQHLVVRDEEGGWQHARPDRREAGGTGPVHGEAAPHHMARTGSKAMGLERGLEAEQPLAADMPVGGAHAAATLW